MSQVWSQPLACSIYFKIKSTVIGSTCWIFENSTENLLLAVSPNGLMFVKPEVRKSLLAKMLSELLDTRVMVKNGIKAAGDDKVSYFQIQIC